MEVGEMKSNNKGFTVIDLMTVMGIIGLLASLAIPAFPKYKTRPLDSEAIAHLQHVYRACKGYWLNNVARPKVAVSPLPVAPSMDTCKPPTSTSPYQAEKARSAAPLLMWIPQILTRSTRPGVSVNGNPALMLI